MTIRNYLEHATADLLAEIEGWKKLGKLEMVANYAAALSTGVRSQRFVLPDGGVCMTEKIVHLAQPVRLPYPSVVFEFLDDHGRGQILFVKEGNGFFGITGAAKEDGGWCFWPYGFGVPIDDLWWMNPRGEPATCVFDFVKNEQVINPATAQQVPGGYDAAVAVLSFVQALQCQNVATDVIPASAPLNKKRARHGKLPFVDYHVLVLKQTREEAAALGGTHAGPRRHIRRGHVRRLPNGTRIWIEQMFVGRADLGFVHKDYRVSV